MSQNEWIHHLVIIITETGFVSHRQTFSFAFGNERWMLQVQINPIENVHYTFQEIMLKKYTSA